MANQSIIKKLENQFEFLKTEKILAILLFGSGVTDKESARDTDICIVAPQSDGREIIKKVYENLDVYGKKYDVYCFQELPLYLKWEVIFNHKIIWTRDKGELYEYFYYYRKLYEDQKHRMKMTKEEILKSIAALRASASRP